ncbi:hypothetical protein K501DRAFT_277224 [Backusella circina FSU 941]|nr:hypothetical protein K501DRAFT_277224 [Backusella circina FSU 941]
MYFGFVYRVTEVVTGISSVLSLICVVHKDYRTPGRTEETFCEVLVWLPYVIDFTNLVVSTETYDYLEAEKVGTSITTAQINVKAAIRIHFFWITHPNRSYKLSICMKVGETDKGTIF